MSATTPRRTGTVFIIDDDASFLKSMSRLLGAVGYTVRAFESAQEFLDQLGPDTSGCVVTDLQMPGMDGLKMQEALAKTANPLPVIFLTGQGDIPKTVSAMRSGAEDFLTKRAPKEEVLAAIERAFERETLERQERGRQRDLRHRFHDLSERELEVLSHVVQGKMNKEIAADLNINERTVKLHRTNLTRKLKVQSVAELTRLVDEAGLFKTG
ncbi:MAG TPA: response regulator [Candidatus Acidoferrales bacterium]|jgi:two-component system response regulator FixJ|nr:response regulator [Candidatus Acidoferrales bacterium]